MATHRGQLLFINLGKCTRACSTCVRIGHCRLRRLVELRPFRYLVEELSMQFSLDPRMFDVVFATHVHVYVVTHLT